MSSQIKVSLGYNTATSKHSEFQLLIKARACKLRFLPELLYRFFVYTHYLWYTTDARPTAAVRLVSYAREPIVVTVVKHGKYTVFCGCRRPYSLCSPVIMCACVFSRAVGWLTIGRRLFVYGSWLGDTAGLLCVGFVCRDLAKHLTGVRHRSKHKIWRMLFIWKEPSKVESVDLLRHPSI